MCCHQIKKPNCNVSVLFKHSNFCSGYWKCILRDQDFKIFPGEHAPRPPLKLTPSALRRCEVFPSPSTPKLLSPTYYLIENPDILLPKSSTGTKFKDANTEFICASKVMEYTQVGFLPGFLPVNVCQSFSLSTK